MIHMHMHHHVPHTLKERSSASALIGAFMAGIAAAAFIGIYLFSGAEGRQRQRALERWVDEMKERVRERVRDMQDASKEQYDAIVDEVVEDYALAKDLTRAQAQKLASRFKKRYRDVRSLAEDAAARAREDAADLDDDMLLDEEA